MRSFCSHCSDEFKNAFAEYAATLRKERTADEYVGHINQICNTLSLDFPEITEGMAFQYFHDLRQTCREGKLSIQTARIRLSAPSFSSFRTSRPMPLLAPVRTMRFPLIIFNISSLLPSEDKTFLGRAFFIVSLQSAQACADWEGGMTFAVDPKGCAPWDDLRKSFGRYRSYSPYSQPIFLASTSSIKMSFVPTRR